MAPFGFKHGPISDHPDLETLVRPGYDRHMFRRPNVALCTLASLLPDSIEFDYLDEQYGDIDTTQAYDIVAISAMTTNAKRSYEIAAQFRKTGAHVIMGGIHISMVPEEAVPYVDSIVVGEGEEAWLEFLEDFKNERPKKIYQGGNVELNQSPAPRYDFLPNEAFYSPFFQREVFTYQYTRGCPHKCTFCASSKVYGKKYRIKAIDKYIQEISVGMERSNNHLHFFADDNVFVNPRQSIELLDELKGLKTIWFGSSDLAVAKNDLLLKKIRDSGCYCLLIGFETLSEENLKRVDPFKAKMFDQYDQYIEKIHDFGINIAASFIVGFDHDNLDTFEQIYEFAARNKVFLCNTSILTPYPSTAIYDQFKAEKRLTHEGAWEKCTGMNLLYQPKNMTSEELLRNFTELTRNELQRSAPDRHFFQPVNFTNGIPANPNAANG